MRFGDKLRRKNVLIQKENTKIIKKYSVFLEDLDSLIHDLSVIILLGVQFTNDRDELRQTCLVQKFTIPHQFSSNFTFQAILFLVKSKIYSPCWRRRERLVCIPSSAYALGLPLSDLLLR